MATYERTGLGPNTIRTQERVAQQLHDAFPGRLTIDIGETFRVQGDLTQEEIDQAKAIIQAGIQATNRITSIAGLTTAQRNKLLGIIAQKYLDNFYVDEEDLA